MKTILPVLLALFMLTLAGLVTAQAGATIFAGNITIGTSPATTGTVIDVFNGSNSAPTKSITVGSGDQQGIDTARFNYSAVANCDNSTAVFLKVWGINGTAQGCIFAAEISANISVSLIASGASCKYANACSGGYCCSGATVINSSTGSGTCQASACAAAASPSTGGGGSSGSGGGGGGAASSGTTAPAAPSQETVDLVTSVLPATFQVAADSGSVEFKTVSAPAAQSVSVVPSAVTQTLEQVGTIVKTDEAKTALAAIQADVSGGGSSPISVTKSIEVVQATNKVSGEKLTVSVVKLSVKAPADKGLKNVEVVEVIPKAVASHVNQITFTGEKPVVLEADPVVKWTFAELAGGQSKDLSYTVGKDISGIGTSTVAVSKKEAAPAVPPAPEAPSTPSGGEKAVEAKPTTPVSSILVVVIAAVVIVGGWFFFKRRKPQK